MRRAIARDKGGGETINLAGGRHIGRGNCDDVTAGPSVVLPQTPGGDYLTTDGGASIAVD